MDGLTVNVQNYTGDKPIEIEYRVGKVAMPVESLPVQEPIKIDITGVLSTPYDWLSKRIEFVDQSKACVEVDREDMTITLVINEDDAYTRGIIKGQLEFSDCFKNLQINSNTGWAPAKLGQVLRLNRALFEDKQQCLLLVSTLKNFSATAKAEILKQRDPSGSMADVYRCQVESNLPKSFILNIPVFKGTAKTAIEVEFDHYLADGDVLLQLISPGAYELVEDYKDYSLDEVITRIKEIAPQIPVIEK